MKKGLYHASFDFLLDVPEHRNDLLPCPFEPMDWMLIIRISYFAHVFQPKQYESTCKN